MKNLTDELNIINESITFVDENDFEYLIMRYPTNRDFKKVEINIGLGVQFGKPELFFGANFCIKEDGNLYYPQIGVFPLSNKNMEMTKKFREYLLVNQFKI
jgi:hypothetical protein